jgi:transcriptional regulator with XRE-family HTH domain
MKKWHLYEHDWAIDIRARREKAGLSLEDVSAQLERKKSWLSKIENERLRLRLGDYLDLVHAIGILNRAKKQRLTPNLTCVHSGNTKGGSNERSQLRRKARTKV